VFEKKKDDIMGVDCLCYPYHAQEECEVLEDFGEPQKRSG